MTDLFLRTVNLSYSALWIVAAVVLLRVVLRKAPRWSHVLLWGVVAVRLLVPVTVESSLSLQPSAQVLTVTQQAQPVIHTGLAAANRALAGSQTVQQLQSGGQHVNWLRILTAVWLVGMLVMGLYGAVSFGVLRRRLRGAEALEPGVFVSRTVAGPFVLGLIHPVVYLPEDLTWQERTHILAHERAHICRKDHLWKPLGFLLLSIHWFNPALWLAYGLLCRDIELACDEKVIRELSPAQRADYSQTILQQSVDHRRVAACPLAFGEAGTKTRVRHVLGWKKPGFWIVLAAVLAVGITAVCLLTAPKSGEAESAAEQSGAVRTFVDYWDSPGEMADCEMTLPEFPGVTFQYSSGQVVAHTEIGNTILIGGMPIWNVYFSDLTGDGLPEVCATVSYGSGVIDEHVVVVDYTDGTEYTLWERGEADYRLRLAEGVLICDRRPYGEKTVVESGPLVLTDGVLTLAAQSAVLVDGLAAGGQAVWQTFYEATRRGEAASVQIVRNYDELPEPVVQRLSFDGSTYRLQWEEDGGAYDREFEYLMYYETQGYATQSHSEPVTYGRYVLTHDRTVTYEQLMQSVASSVSGAYIAHMEVWAEIT